MNGLDTHQDQDFSCLIPNKLSRTCQGWSSGVLLDAGTTDNQASTTNETGRMTSSGRQDFKDVEEEVLGCSTI